MTIPILVTTIRVLMVLIEYPYLLRYKVKPKRDWDKHSASVWDTPRNETKELALRRHQGGATYFYLDGHARWRTWDQVWWQDRARGVYEGDFDPRQ